MTLIQRMRLYSDLKIVMIVTQIRRRASLHHWCGLPGAYPGGRTLGGPSKSLILAPSELKNVALTPPPPLNMTRCETRHCNFVNMSEIFIQTYVF